MLSKPWLEIFMLTSLGTSICFVVWAADRSFGGPFQTAPRFRSSRLLDIFCGILDGTGLRTFIYQALLFMIIPYVPNLGRWTEAWSEPLRFALYFLTYDFSFYWYHRLIHLDPFWREHSFHHSATELTPLTSLRLHVLSYPTHFVCVFLPSVILFPLSQPMFLVFIVLTSIHGAVVHSRWRSDWGFLGKWLLVNPTFHAQHHTDSGQRVNFGAFFSFWDRIFGTYRAADPKTREYAFGPANSTSYGPVQTYFLVFKSFFRRPAQGQSTRVSQALRRAEEQ